MMMTEHEEVPTTAGGPTEEGDFESSNNTNMQSDEMESLFLHDDHPQPQSNGHQFNHPLSSSSSNQNPNSSSFNSFLEPPSYADAMFTSFDSNFHVASPNSASSSATSSSTSPPSSYLRISVSDPQKVYDPSSNSGSLVSNNYFYTYLITSRTNLDCFKSTEFSIRRRFSDVVAFSDKLSAAHRGLFIPLRPDKNVVESQMMSTEEFVEQRRVALEKYLRKLAAHPVIRLSEEFRAFLEVEGRVFDGGVSEMGVGTGEAKAAGRDFFRMFKELKQSVTNDWVGVKPLVGEDDKEFLERKEKLQDFEHQLTNISEQAESLVKAQQDIGETMGELGLAFVKLTKFETEEALYDSQRVRAGDMKNIATAAVKGSRLYRELNSQTVKHLDKLHEYLGMMLAVNNAFNDRSNALLTVQTLLSDISSLNTRIEKLEVASSKIFGGDRSRTRRIEELKETIRVTEEAKCCATTEYERIKENNKNELGRLDKEMHNDFLSMLKGFVVNQAGYAEKMANVWETVAEETKGYARESS